MLQRLRQSSQLYARTLLGMLLFVWLSMAITPCVMASELQLNNSAEQLALHVEMQDCAYCPAESESISHIELCENAHNNFSDTLNASVDSIDLESLVLVELPQALLQIFDHARYPVSVLNQADFSPTLPLSLTGILRI